MAKSREEVQDNALYHMAKLSRSVGNARDNKVLSLAEQIANLEKGKDTKLSSMAWRDWLRHIQTKLKENRIFISSACFEYVTDKYRTKLEEMQAKSSSTREVVNFIDDHAIEWLNV